MDRRWRPAWALGLILLGAATLAAAQAAGVPLRAMRWLAPGADAARVLTQAPAECLAAPLEAAVDRRVQIGRAAFRTPVLLGGQAARAGLSCESCHRNGRGNPDFQFPGVSGAPGTADVTSSLFSSHRGNGVADPKPIPDLSAPKATLKVSQATGDPRLAQFIRGLIVEEFDGPEPAPAILEGLTAYVRALDPARCAATPEPVRVADLMRDVDLAAGEALSLTRDGDRPAAQLMISAARARLGLVDERYAAPDLARLRRRLRAADADLAAISDSLRTGRDPRAELIRWMADTRRLSRDLVAGEARSLFNPARLSRAANRRLPREAS